MPVGQAPIQQTDQTRLMIPGSDVLTTTATTITNGSMCLSFVCHIALNRSLKKLYVLLILYFILHSNRRRKALFDPHRDVLCEVKNFRGIQGLWCFSDALKPTIYPLYLLLTVVFTHYFSISVSTY